tara:strand:- start:690 stop:1007 length:318 start_codon:yes stop_codon:yes gene_type:complete
LEQLFTLFLFCFVHLSPGDATKEWVVDLKTAPGRVAAEKAAKPDCTLTVSDADFIAMAEGKANAQQLFMQGKVKLQGNMALAMKVVQSISTIGFCPLLLSNFSAS